MVPKFDRIFFYQIRATGIKDSSCCRSIVYSMDHVFYPPSLTRRNKWESHPRSYSRIRRRRNSLLESQKSHLHTQLKRVYKSSMDSSVTEEVYYTKTKLSSSISEMILLLGLMKSTKENSEPKVGKSQQNPLKEKSEPNQIRGSIRETQESTSESN